MPGPPELVRPWRGVSAEQRIAERRERLLEAALEVFSARTFRGSKVRDICGEAGLTERYFYESFRNKEALLGALTDRIVAEFVAAAAPSIALAATDVDAAIQNGVQAFVASLTGDPRRARILFIESVGVSAAAENKRRAVIASLVDVVVGAAERAFGPWVRDSVEVELIARSLIGAVSELLVAYVREELPLDEDELVLNISRLFKRGRPILVAMAAERSKHNPAGS